MAKILVKSKRYRFTENEFKMLELLKFHGIVESRFVRNAIKEKFERDYPEIKAKEKRIKLPF